jgi:hypothetical protein
VASGLKGQVPDELKDDLVDQQMPYTTERVVTSAEMRYIRDFAERAWPVPVSYEMLRNVAINRENTPLEASPQASQRAAQDFTKNVWHFLGEHDIPECTMHDEYTPGDPRDEQGKHYLEVEVDEGVNDPSGRYKPFVQSRLNRPITAQEKEAWFGISSPDYPYRVHEELTYMVVDDGGLKGQHERLRLTGEEVEPNLRLMTMTSARVMLGKSVEHFFPTKVTTAEASEAWMVAHFLWNGKPKIYNP